MQPRHARHVQVMNGVQQHPPAGRPDPTLASDPRFGHQRVRQAEHASIAHPPKGQYADRQRKDNRRREAAEEMGHAAIQLRTRAFKGRVNCSVAGPRSIARTAMEPQSHTDACRLWFQHLRDPVHSFGTEQGSPVHPPLPSTRPAAPSLALVESPAQANQTTTAQEGSAVKSTKKRAAECSAARWVERLSVYSALEADGSLPLPVTDPTATFALSTHSSGTALRAWAA